MKISFFLPMRIPTVTHQEQRIAVRKGKPAVYDTPELKEARARFAAHLSKHAPAEKLKGPIRLIVKWCFPMMAGHTDGEYKITKPDTDNTIKLFKDCMTRAGFWVDDALVASELTEKFWAGVPGVFVKIETIEGS